ncbi:hypothetical protein ABL78_5230 [Leptomonas seymouri]|uniref:Uncharacterized protein n=1 Tax=Leptomonas seymouri TaxID=5684 RepID=A0A0N1PCN9_LEPSE|nr:hypothetical protein ABL78_5230 [Leptomonas seymouri]|eukprot:KPI85698.1 hypothetical protein ABL78_5230 [Leptomonas seymouri]
MPTASSTTSTSEKQELRKKFSAAATALADLYRESSNSYETGYRDALLFVQRYLQSSAPAATQAPAAPSPSGSPSSFTSVGLCTTVNAAQMMRFLQDTAAARRERMAVVRGVRSMRRRQRDTVDAADGPPENSNGATSDSEEGEGEEAMAEAEEGAPGLAPQQPPTPTVDLNQLTTIPSQHGFPAGYVDSMLNQEIELITHLEPRVSAQLTPLQPRRQRRRTDRARDAQLRRFHSPRGHPYSPQLHVGRGK